MEVEPPVAQQPAVDERRLVGLEVVQDTSRSARTSRFTLFKKATKSVLVWDFVMSVITVPVAASSAAKRSQVPLD